MRAIWTGSISFGLVTIPIALYPATRHDELKFHLLRKSDLSPVNYKRVATVDGKEVPWDQLVKGYEYEKGKYVILKDEDFQRVDIEATQTVDILNFVHANEVDPLLFNKPYYMEVGKGGDKAYDLLYAALQKSDKIAIAKVIIKTRQHLAAIKPKQGSLMLELMYFPQDLVDTSAFKTPKKVALSKPELAMATQLIDSMTEKWRPDAYTDEYRDALEKMIEEKVQNGGRELPTEKPHVKRPSNVIDLVSVLQKSIQQASSSSKEKSIPAKKQKAPAKAKVRAKKKAA